MPAIDCPHTSVTCLNQYETIRKYSCDACAKVMMCACDERFGRRHLPHQLSQGCWLETRERVPVTLGFQLRVCNTCRGLAEPSAPKAALFGRTSKIHRYYWREISLRTSDRFAEWAELQGLEYRPLLGHEPAYEEEYRRIEQEVVEELKREHHNAPNYKYQQSSTDEVIRENGVNVVTLDADYSEASSKGRTIKENGCATSVEDFVSRHFKEQGYVVTLTESVPFHALFGCLMYDVVCDETDPFARQALFGTRDSSDRDQSGSMIGCTLPSDFGTPGYGTRRAQVIETHLASIGSSQQELRAAFERAVKRSEPLRQYLWAHRADAISTAARILEMVPADGICRSLAFLASDYWRNYLGWPDLLVHRSSSDYFFAEVKGSGDKLSDEQRNWIAGNAKVLLMPFKLVKVSRRPNSKR